MKKTSLLILFIWLSLSSCKHHSPSFKMPENIAILPTINQTTDVLGGIVFRNLFFLALTDKKPVNLIPIEFVDTLLNEEGITQGGQLAAVDTSELFQILKVDGLLFITLFACDYQTLGISETRRVKAHFSLIAFPDESRWSFEYEVDRGKSAIDSFLGLLNDSKSILKDTAEDFGKQLAEKGGRMWLLKHPLKPEMDILIEETIDDLP